MESFENSKIKTWMDVHETRLRSKSYNLKENVFLELKAQLLERQVNSPTW